MKKKKGKRKNCIKKSKFADFAALCRKNSVFRAGLVILTLMIALTGGTYVYAKYYSISAREGIAIATGVYFTANYAVVSEDGEFVETLVSSGYKGGDASFSLEVRNFENNLLFNTSNVDIPYTVELWLESAPTDDAEYSVSIGDGVNSTKQVLTVGEGNKVTITGQSIAGGAARANTYYINVDAPSDSGHTPIPIYVRVQTLEGSLINRTLTGKMVLSSTGRVESYIDSQGFVIPEEPADVSEFERLTSLSAFTYEVLTVGSVASSGVTEELKISWDSTVLSIDLFDEAYMAWEEKTKETAPLPLEGKEGWYYITIEVLPYSAENISFFRGSDFETKATDLETLEGFIKAEKIVTTTTS